MTGAAFQLPASWDTMSDDRRERWAFRQKNDDGSWISPREQQWRISEYNANRVDVETFDDGSSGAVSSNASSNSPFMILTRTDLRRMPRVSWLVDGLIQTSGLVVLAGDGGIGKSAIAIDWAASLAAGRDAWHGKRVIAGGASVLYVAGEGVEGVEDRLAAWEVWTGVSIPDERLEFVSEGFSLSDERAAFAMELAVKERDYALVILDTLSQLSSVENENDNAELSKVLNVARGIRQARPGTTVLIVHHISKGGRVRGASAIRNNADAVIVARADGGVNVSTFSISTEHEHDGKQKNGPAETMDGFWLDSVASGVVVKRGGSDAMGRAIDGVLADGLDHDGNEFYVACVAADDATKKVVRRRLQKLVDDGLVVVTGARQTTRWRRA